MNLIFSCVTSHKGDYKDVQVGIQQMQVNQIQLLIIHINS
jgi:putative lipoic acid-binding regulatory protein